MTLMPNLHTLQILTRMYGDPFGPEVKLVQFRNAFAGRVFPSVRRVLFPAQARPILECFPEVVEVFVGHTGLDDFSQFIDDMIPHCRKVESLGWQEGLGYSYGGYTSITCPRSNDGCSCGRKVAQSPQGRTSRGTGLRA